MLTFTILYYSLEFRRINRIDDYILHPARAVPLPAIQARKGLLEICGSSVSNLWYDRHGILVSLRAGTRAAHRGG